VAVEETANPRSFSLIIEWIERCDQERETDQIVGQCSKARQIFPLISISVYQRLLAVYLNFAKGMIVFPGELRMYNQRHLTWRKRSEN
jgi:hypothetical protein